MPVGPSGRLVVEIDPQTKEELYSALRAEGLTLKGWFLSNVEEYLSHKGQLNLQFDRDLVESTTHVATRDA
ncbi:MAG: hypothetical protein ABFS45_00900 [Pseudomonadota bacterium]